MCAPQWSFDPLYLMLQQFGTSFPPIFFIFQIIFPLILPPLKAYPFSLQLPVMVNLELETSGLGFDFPHSRV